MKQPILYTPSLNRSRPKRLLDVPSAWRGIESILNSIIYDFEIGTKLAVEFGVEYGYSTAALANYFGQVIGVDSFLGLDHDRDPDFYGRVRVQLFNYHNVTVLQEDWKGFAALDKSEIDLIHIDLDHNYQQTFEAGEWAIAHAPVTIFHDTMSWAGEVGRACGDLAEKHGLYFYNYEPSNGLGILSRKEKR